MIQLYCERCINWLDNHCFYYCNEMRAGMRFCGRYAFSYRKKVKKNGNR